MLLLYAASAALAWPGIPPFNLSRAITQFTCLNLKVKVTVNMPDLKQQFFNGSGEIPPDILAKLLSPATGIGLIDTLNAWQWQGNVPAAAICLSTSTDGTRVQGGAFSLWGDLSASPVEFPASKLWEGTSRGTTVTIRNLTGQTFTFAGGQLHSDYVDADDCDVTFSKGGQPILPADWESAGVGPFALRAFTHVDKTSNKSDDLRIKFTVLAFPDCSEALEQLSERTQHPTWPGIKILEGSARFFRPLPTGLAWGAPLLPFICTRDRSPTATATPPADHLRFAIAEIMRTAALPTACTTRGALNLKGQQLLDAAEDPELRGPTVTWPPVERPAPDLGKTNLLR